MDVLFWCGVTILVLGVSAGAWVVGVFACQKHYLKGMSEGESHERRRGWKAAIEAGVARWECDPTDGETRFVWIGAKKEEE